jgi:photosystem II stability/assembly factor-like uncharacterized protein
MRNLYFLLPVFLLLAMTDLYSQQQSVLSYIRENVDEDPTIFEMQRIFNEWAEDKDLDKQKGWKYLRRLLWSESLRTAEYGDPVDRSTFNNALDDIMAQRAPSAQRSGNSWLPEGPSTIPIHKTAIYAPGVGRINCIAFHPSDTSIMYIGTPGGSIWKTTNHGISWLPLGDDLPVPSVSDIAIDPNNPETLYLATGDFDWAGVAMTPLYNFGGNGTLFGVGILKSTDGGLSWESTGLSYDKTDFGYTMIRRIFVNPANSNEVVAAGIRGIWKSEDAGNTWSRIEKNPFIDLKQSPAAPNELFAVSASFDSTLNFASQIPTIYRSTDFGDSWEPVYSFSPGDEVFRVELEVAPSDPEVIYAVSATAGLGALEGFYRSTDGGDSWEKRLDGDTLNILGLRLGDPSDDFFGQGWYDLTLAVDQDDSDRVFVGGINHWGSGDGGKEWSLVAHWTTVYGPSVHADHHRMRQNPLNGNFYLCTDGGLYYTDDLIIPEMDSIKACGLPNEFFFNWPSLEDCFSFPTEWKGISTDMQITEFYKLDVFPSDPTYLLAGSQDNSQFYRDSSGWTNIFGGDGMDGMFDPTDPRTIYGSFQLGSLNKSTDGGETVDWLITDAWVTDFGAWITPFAINPQNPDILYGGYSQIWRSENAGALWERISILPSGFVPTRQLVLSPTNPDWLATIKSPEIDQGEPRVFATWDAGDLWIEIGDQLPTDGLYLSDITFANDSADLMVTYAGFAEGDKVYRTKDGGFSWENISKDLPNIPVICIAHHAGSNNNITYIGTDNGLYYTWDGLDKWVPYNEGLPNVRVSDIELNYETNQVFAATYGRGIWSNNMIPDTATVLNVEALESISAEVEVMPNPNTGQFKLKIGKSGLKEGRMRITDVMGRQVYSEPLDFSTGRIEKMYNLDLPSGLYYLSIQQGERRKTVRFIIQ